MFPFPAKLPKWITENLMNTSVKSQLLKHLQVFAKHMLRWQRQCTSGRCEQTPMWVRRHSSCCLQTDILAQKKEPEQISTTVGCSTEYYELLWMILQFPTWNRIRKWSACLKYIPCSWYSTWLWLNYVFSFLHFLTSNIRAKQWQLDTGLPLKQNVNIASPLTVLGLWLLVASL